MISNIIQDLLKCIDKLSDTWLGAYTDDVREIANTQYPLDRKPFKLYDPRPINISTFIIM
jgi:hypothetical protein